MKLNKQQFKAVITSGCLLILASPVNAASQTDSLPTIQKQWAKCQYDTFNKDNKIECLEGLVKQTQQSLNQAPNRSDLKVWLAITKSTLAGVDGGLGALSLAKESKILLDDVIKKDPEVLDGSAFTSLGSLYYKVPGWPIGFGDDDKAEEMLKKALAINPTGIDPNYFYGDFLAQDGRQSEAIVYLKKAQQAAPRSQRPLADKGRQQEIANRLKELQ
jgi:tetratricopeptide (TPR) repeat protein